MDAGSYSRSLETCLDSRRCQVFICIDKVERTVGRICGSGEGHAGVSSAANAPAPRLMTSPTRVLTLRRHVETSHLEDDKAGREGTSRKHFLLLIG